MEKRKMDVATLCSVSEDQVEEVSEAQIRQVLTNRVSPDVLEVGTQEPATYWRVGDRYFLDDPFFGEVTDFADLRYNRNLGLYVPSDLKKTGATQTSQGEQTALPMHLYKVGELYNPNITYWQETVQYNFRGGAHELCLFFRQPSSKEMQAVNSGRKEFALVVDGDVIVFLFRFSGTGGNQSGIPWSDSPYSWHLLPPNEQSVLPIDPKNMTLQGRTHVGIFLIDADTGIIVAKRDMVTFSHEFTVALHQAILDQIKRPFDKVHYDRDVRALQARYQRSEEMVALARVRCVGGE